MSYRQLILKSTQIEEMEGDRRVHFLNANAQRVRKAIGDEVGLSKIGVHIIYVEKVRKGVMSFSQYPRSNKKVINIPYLYVFIFMTGMLTSCTSNHADAPTSWDGENSITAQGCADISGIYRNLGEDAPKNKDKDIHRKYPQYLSEFFIPLLVNGRKHRWITHVEISGVHRGELVLVFKKRDKTIDKLILKEKKDLSCTAQGIEIKETSAMHYNIASLGDIRTNTLVLSRGRDASLLVEEIEKEKGVAMLILVPVPYATSTIQYYRFPSEDR